MFIASPWQQVHVRTSRFYHMFHQQLEFPVTHWGVNVQVLDLTFKLVHDRWDLLQVHGAQSLVQSLGHLTHTFGHLRAERWKPSSSVTWMKKADVSAGGADRGSPPSWWPPSGPWRPRRPLVTPYAASSDLHSFSWWRFQHKLWHSPRSSAAEPIRDETFRHCPLLADGLQQ